MAAAVLRRHGFLGWASPEPEEGRGPCPLTPGFHWTPGLFGFYFLLPVMLMALLENVTWFTPMFLSSRAVSNIECTRNAPCTFPGV